MQKPTLAPYVRLMQQFVQGQMSAEQFEHAYLHLFKQDSVRWSKPVFAVLNDLFLDVDAFCSDPSLRGAQDIGEVELRAQAQAAYAKLSLRRKTRERRRSKKRRRT